ncbi:hypothetical protein AgCh_021741 [Apium graveolens]
MNFNPPDDSWYMDTGAFSHLTYNADDFTNYLWVPPLKYKSQVYDTFITFNTYVKTQFERSIKSYQCDNGREFDNRAFHDFCAKHGMDFSDISPFITHNLVTDHAPTKVVPSRSSMASPNDFLTSPSHSPSIITPSREATSRVPNQHHPLQSFGKVYSRRVVPTPSTPTVQPPKSTRTPPRMTTRSQLGIIKPKRQFNLNSITTSIPLLRSHIQALKRSKLDCSFER